MVRYAVPVTVARAVTIEKSSEVVAAFDANKVVGYGPSECPWRVG